MASARVPKFRPSKCGFPFANDFEAGPVLTLRLPLVGDIPVGNAAGGLCGGMVFTALDLFRRGLPPPEGPAPKPGAPLFKYFARRLFSSFNGLAGVYKYLKWMRLPDEPRLFGLYRSIQWHTVNREWPAIRADLDGGRPCPLGLIKARSINPLHLGDNHQVLAYGYDLDEGSGQLTVYVYDPNEPGDDNVRLSVNVADPGNPSPVTYSADKAGRGFFRTPYRPANPVI
jgi:hypothetical protein